MVRTEALRPVAGDLTPVCGTVESPVFLVGCIRSGTTLLRLMLDHHPDVDFFPEFEFALEHVGEDGRFPDPDAYRRLLADNRVFQDAGLDLVPGLGYAAQVNGFLLRKRCGARKPLVGATVHHSFDRIPYVWPGARYIHLVRDGRDVSRSMVEMGFVGNAYAGAGHWAEVENLWADFARTVPPERRAEVRYEDLVARPEETLSRVCEFLGVPYRPAMLDYPGDSTYGPPSPKLAGRWRTMPPGDVDAVESRIGGMLLRRGYELSGRPWRKLSDGEDRRLTVRHRLARAKFRLARYGPPLFFSELATRRLRFDALHGRLVERINEIDRRHLK